MAEAGRRPKVYRPERNTLLFLGGLHRSGTTPLSRTLAKHRQISPLNGTGAKKNEGQHVQSVYPAAAEHGGPGRFATRPEAHLTEESPLATEESARRLWEAWSPYWNLKRRVLMEKSPPNLLMTRFLASLFPSSRQLLIMRHPVVVALSTAKWMDGETPADLVEHWLSAHERLREDLAHLHAAGGDSAAVITYEALVRRPEDTLGRVCAWLGIDHPPEAGRLESERSSRYQQAWEEMATGGDAAAAAARREVLDRFSERAAAFGYDLEDLEQEGSHGLPRP